MKALKELRHGGVKSVFLRDQAVKLIKGAILRGEIPPGEVISNEQLSAWLGISRTPIREALLELQRGGMVIIHRGKGTEVARLSRKDVVEIFETREALEVKSCELMIERMGDGSIKGLESILEKQARDASRGEELGFLEGDHQFHLLLAKGSGNGRLYNAVEAMRDQCMLLGTYALRQENRMSEVLGEHREIVEALRRRDPSAARDAVIAHLRRSCNDVLIQFPGSSGGQDDNVWDGRENGEAGAGVL